MNLRIFRACAGLTALCVQLTWAQLTCALAADLTVIDLHNRTAEELLPVLRPMAGSASLSGADYKLFVRGETADVARIRQMLDVLDRAPRQLIVSVRYSGRPESQDTAAGVGATVSNRGTDVVINGRSVHSTASDYNISSVRVLEGNGAHIATGQSVPVVSAFMLTPKSSNHGPGVGVATDYRELSTGFDVVPRVNGERVMLDITAQQQRPADSGNGGAISQRASTTIAGKLGEWLEIGGAQSSSGEQRNVVGIAGASRRVTTQSDARTLAVKVELAQ